MSTDYVFVISQIGDKGTPERKRADDIYDYVVKEVAKDLGLLARRSDLDPTPGQITAQIVRGIVNANAVIADLTGRNPNVYYELGVANAFAKPTILLVKDTAGLPFDVRNERMIVVGGSDVLGVGEAAEAKTALRTALDVILAADYKVSNLVTEAAAARSLDALAPNDPIASELSAIREKLDVLNTHPGWDHEWNDILQLKSLLENQAAKGNLPVSWLSEISTSETTVFFDEWLKRLRGRAQRTWSERLSKATVPQTSETRRPTRGPVSRVSTSDSDEEPF